MLGIYSINVHIKELMIPWKIGLIIGVLFLLSQPSKIQMSESTICVGVVLSFSAQCLQKVTCKISKEAKQNWINHSYFSFVLSNRRMLQGVIAPSSTGESRPHRPKHGRLRTCVPQATTDSVGDTVCASTPLRFNCFVSILTRFGHNSRYRLQRSQCVHFVGSSGIVFAYLFYIPLHRIFRMINLGSPWNRLTTIHSKTTCSSDCHHQIQT